MYHIAICDDEPLFAEDLHRKVEQIFRRHKIEYTISIFSDPSEFLSKLNEEPDAFHLVLLDILMGKINGIRLAEELRKKGNRIGIIFITAEPSFALEGYSVRPIQYLLKPVDSGKLEEAVLFDYDQNSTRKNLMISIGQKTYSLPFPDITYIEVYGHTLNIHMENEALECAGTLKEMADILPDHFLRCHRSYMINLARVRDIKRYSFTLDTGETVPIGKENYLSVQQAFITHAVW